MSLKLEKLLASVLSSCVLLSSGSSCFALGSAMLYGGATLGLGTVAALISKFSRGNKGDITLVNGEVVTGGDEYEGGKLASGGKGRNRTVVQVCYDDDRGILVDGRTCRERAYEFDKDNDSVYVDDYYGSKAILLIFDDDDDETCGDLCRLRDISELGAFNLYMGGVPGEWMEMWHMVYALNGFRILVDKRSGFLELRANGEYSGERSHLFELQNDSLSNKKLSDCILNMLFESAGIKCPLRRFFNLPLSMRRHIARVVETIFRIIRVHSS